MKSRFYKLALIIVILILAVGSCRKAGTWLVKTDVPEHADVMIMLMGGVASDRILQIADLYQENVSGEVWVVEEGSGARNILEERGVRIISSTQQVYGAFLSLGIPEDNIVILPGGATSTQMEVEIIRDYLAARQGTAPPGTESSGTAPPGTAPPGTAPSVVDTLLVVSSASHMRRASMIFNAAFKSLDQPVVICCSPSPYTKFNAEKWWRDRDDIQDVVMEYLKILNFVLFEKRDLKKETS